MVKHDAIFVLMLALASVAPAENMVFPPDAGVKNVKEYGAKGAR